MVAALVLASVMSVADTPSSGRHVRSADVQIQALLEQGVARSATFRHLLDTLDASDVIVYVMAKRTHPELSGYLPHRITMAGSFRYLHVMVDLRGAENRILSVIAHELQHAVEVAEAPDVSDDRSLTRLFSRSRINFHCGEDCFETQAAMDVQYTVIGELTLNHRPSSMASR
jgi:hypothetical protein